MWQIILPFLIVGTCETPFKTDSCRFSKSCLSITANLISSFSAPNWSFLLLMKQRIANLSICPSHKNPNRPIKRKMLLVLRNFLSLQSNMADSSCDFLNQKFETWDRLLTWNFSEFFSWHPNIYGLKFPEIIVYFGFSQHSNPYSSVSCVRPSISHFNAFYLQLVFWFRSYPFFRASERGEPENFKNSFQVEFFRSSELLISETTGLISSLKVSTGTFVYVLEDSVEESTNLFLASESSYTGKAKS